MLGPGMMGHLFDKLQTHTSRRMRRPAPQLVVLNVVGPPRRSQSQVRHDSPLRHTRSPPRRDRSPPRWSRSPPPRNHPSDPWQPPTPHRRPSVNRNYPNRLPPPGPPVPPSLPGSAVMPSLPNPTVTCEHKTNFDIHHGKGRCDVCSK
jgi:hypothetical protein